MMDPTLILVAVIAAVPPTVFGWLSYRQSQRNAAQGAENKAAIGGVSIAIDGRLTELLELTRKSSRAEGVQDERNAHLERSAPSTVDKPAAKA